MVFPRWSPGKFPYNVTHNSDVTAALWRCATWIEEIGGRTKADELAGEIVHWHNEKKLVGQVEGMVPHNVVVKAPLFNLASLTRYPRFSLTNRT
jgi:hypothetical protein